jgi:hypothetical protein
MLCAAQFLQQALQAVEPPSFLVVMEAAAAARRMEYVQVMMRALDDQLQLQVRVCVGQCTLCT